MAFTLNGALVTFDLAEFERLVTAAGGFTFRWKTSSMGPLRELAQQKVGGYQMRMAAERIGSAKAAKYEKAMKYLVFHYEGLIPDSEIVRVNDPRKGGIRDTFHGWVAKQAFAREKIGKYEGKAPPPSNVGDLIYGCDSGRKLPAYKTPHPLICDSFNNAASIGSGDAFRRQWNGIGSLEATPTTVLQNVTAAMQAVIDAPEEDEEDVPSGFKGREAMKAYRETLVGSRYSPEKAFDVPTNKLEKDTYKTRAQMKAIYKRDPEAHLWMNARFIKAVRRACKGGIAMAATHPVFKEHNSKVFFILDQLGDLGSVAFKKALPDRGDYVPITSSELSFVFRYWNHAEVPLKGLLKFFVDGREVMAPWEGDWRLKDGKGADVYSNHEAWKRYSLYRSIAKPEGKPFPKSGEDEESTER